MVRLRLSYPLIKYYFAPPLLLLLLFLYQRHTIPSRPEDLPSLAKMQYSVSGGLSAAARHKNFKILQKNESEMKRQSSAASRKENPKHAKIDHVRILCKILYIKPLMFLLRVLAICPKSQPAANLAFRVGPILKHQINFCLAVASLSSLSLNA